MRAGEIDLFDDIREIGRIEGLRLAKKLLLEWEADDDTPARVRAEIQHMLAEVDRLGMQPNTPPRVIRRRR